PHVNRIRVRRRYGYVADRAGRLIVEHRKPGAPGIVGLPDAAIIDADVEHVRLLRNTRRAHRPPAAIWPDGAPPQPLIKLRIEVLRREREEKKEDRNRLSHGFFENTTVKKAECRTGKRSVCPHVSPVS